MSLTAGTRLGPYEILAPPTRQKDLTKERSIIGTLQYMAPEQLEGKEIDARTDIFAFGALLYEMITGRKAFEGNSQASLIAAILEREPAPITTLQPLSPPPLDHVVTTCLAKDPERRWQTARDLTLELEWCTESAAGAAASTVSRGAEERYQKRERVLIGTSVVLLALLVWRFLLPSTASDTSITRVEVGLPPGQELTGFLDISPDGKRLAYTARNEVGPTRLYLRSLDTFEPRLVDGTDGADAPFFSPDGEWVGFFANGKLLRVSFAGGEPIEIADAHAIARGGSWGENDSNIFSESGSRLARVSSAGGPVETLTTLNNAEGEYGHAWPQWLPDGRHVLFTIWRAADQLRYSTALLSLDTGTWSDVIEENASGARYVESGHLLYTYGPGSDRFRPLPLRGLANRHSGVQPRGSGQADTRLGRPRRKGDAAGGGTRPVRVPPDISRQFPSRLRGRETTLGHGSRSRHSNPADVESDQRIPRLGT